ncbi:hypothetical protein LY90DRAFT_511458 [Neocallimastix californiae]|uniref:Uncharacterized protein n=1 Tax=Neocallimastix californiae TaxID=1754190 RepID=A0A1Y2BPX4_9FUNG|nr:hypothetical protein LY90DRAFT_511458 [Neocallimastix californiae]|eukprot:ORY36799.1 hypothetical protein LY90DRAFT_511458 [Neocallimastix californiae]
MKEKGNKDNDESETGTNGFLYRFLHKNTVKDKICSIDNLSTSNDSSKGSKNIFGKELDNDKFKSKSQPLFSSKKKKDESMNEISEKSSNVNSIINLLENNKFGSNYSNNESHESASGSHDEFICMDKVKKNIKLFSHKKFNTTTEPNNNVNPLQEANNEIKTSFSLGQIQKDESNLSTINDQSTSSNNGLLVMKKVAAPPKRRPPTKQKLMENAETAFTQRTGDEPSKMVNSPETSYTNFKDMSSSKLPSFVSLKENNCLKESSSKEINENCEEKTDLDDDDKSLFNDNSGNVFDLKKRMTRKLINKQKFSDKLYPGGENCDSSIVESKSIVSINDMSSLGSVSEKEESFVNSPMENIKVTKNTSFNNGPVPPFRKERSVNLGGGFKAPKSPSSGNVSVSSYTTNPVTPVKKMSIQEDNKVLLVTPRVSAKSKRRPPSHIGIAKNSKETIFTLKEDGEDNLLCPSNQESYMTNIKISEVKIAKKIDQKQINVLKLPSKGPAMIDSSNIKEEAIKEMPTNSVKALQKSDSTNSLQSNNNNDDNNNEIKEGKKYNCNSNRSSMHPNFLSELDGQLSKRSSIRSNVDIEEKMQEMAKKKHDQEKEDNNKNIFNVKLKSKGTNFEKKSPCEDSNSNSELVNSPFFKKRANIVNSENEEIKSTNDEEEKKLEVIIN